MTRFVILCLILVASGSASSAQIWEPAASLPGLGRHHPVTFALDGYGYAATGSSTQFGVTDDFYRYDPIGDTWETLTDFPGPDRSYSYGGAFGGKGYLGFGLGQSYLADLWEYDPVLTQWTELAPLPAAGRMHPAFVITDDGKIYVGMGNGSAGNFRDWWEYDIAGNAWTRKADLPGPARHHPYYFNIGVYPYVGLGHGAGAYVDVYRFDPVSNTWARLEDFPAQARVAGTQFTFGGRGYIASGLGANDQPLPTGEFWEYEPSEDSWTELVPHPGSGRWAPGTFVIGATVYLLAGESSVQYERDMWKFDMDAVGVDDASGFGAAPFVLYPNPVPARELRLLPRVPGFEVGSVLLIGVDGRRIAELAGQASTIRIPPRVGAGRYFLSIEARDRRRHTQPIVVLR